MLAITALLQLGVNSQQLHFSAFRVAQLNSTASQVYILRQQQVRNITVLLKLPIMLWSNAPEFCLLCSNYAPYQEFFFLSLCKPVSPQIMSFSSLYFPNTVQFHLSSYSSSTVQHTFSNSYTYKYQHFLLHYKCNLSLKKSLPQIHYLNPVQSMCFILFDAFVTQLLCSGIIGSSLYSS